VCPPGRDRSETKRDGYMKKSSKSQGSAFSKCPANDTAV